LEESEERTYLIQDLRSRIIQRTAGHGLQQRELLEKVFKEIDLDGSGEIDGTEFKSLLVKMDMGYSVKKFMKLYRAIDRDGDGTLSLTELNHLLFPEDAKKQEVEEQGIKIQSRLDRRITELESEQQGETNGVSLGAHRKIRSNLFFKESL
jgi:Ca2+-binding EF-hand superfamily protein